MKVCVCVYIYIYTHIYCVYMVYSIPCNGGSGKSELEARTQLACADQTRVKRDLLSGQKRPTTCGLFKACQSLA